MALDLTGKNMSIGQIDISTYEVDPNAIRVIPVDGSGVPADFATEVTQLDVLAAIENLDSEVALTPVGTPVYNNYTGTPVTTAAYVELVASTPEDIDNLEIFDSSGQSLYLAIGAVGLEEDKCLIIPGGNGRIPFSIPSGSRISAKALTDDADVGYLVINFYA